MSYLFSQQGNRRAKCPRRCTLMPACLSVSILDDIYQIIYKRKRRSIYLLRTETSHIVCSDDFRPSMKEAVGNFWIHRDLTCMVTSDLNGRDTLVIVEFKRFKPVFFTLFEYTVITKITLRAEKKKKGLVFRGFIDIFIFNA